MNAFRQYRPPAFRRYRFKASPRLERRTSYAPLNRVPKKSRQQAAGDPRQYTGSRVRTIGKHWLNKPPIIILSGDRERCNPGTAEGRAEYEWRRILMFLRQYNHDVGAVLCCVCLQPITLSQATWEHEFGRHASRIDERLWNPETQRLQNGVSHSWCNCKRGSQRTPIHHGNNCVIEREPAA